MKDTTTKDEKYEILTSNARSKKEKDSRKKILDKVLDSDVLFIPFDNINHYTYKHQTTLILHYPSKTFLKKEIVKYVLKRNLPLDGIILIRQQGNAKKLIPYAECIISSILLPEELIKYWNNIIKVKKLNPNKTIYQIYTRWFKKFRSAEEDKVFEIFFRQIGYDDDKIQNNIIKIKNNTVDEKDSSLLWIKCEILENITSSHLNKDGKNISFYDYIKDYKLYQHSVAYALPKKEYLNFRKYLKNSSDYVVGKDAISKTFRYLDEIDKLSHINYQTRYKIFSENAWRDLICKPQFVYVDKDFNDYMILIHMIWESKQKEKYELVAFDTEVKCIDISNKKKHYYIDAFINLFSVKRSKNIKLYIEFKNYDKTIYDDMKDYIKQPESIIANKFYSEKYVHNSDDEWYYVAITKGSPYKRSGKPSVDVSGLEEDNYIDLSWEELFRIISNEIYNNAYNSIDKSLINFLNFLERI